MYPTELTKLTISNAEYPAGKAMLICAYADASAQVSEGGKGGGRCSGQGSRGDRKRDSQDGRKWEK